MGAKRTVYNTKLNGNQLAFCYEYIANKFNGTQAAISAGYSENGAGVTASKLLNQANIKEKIAKLTNRHLNSLDVSGEKVIQELAKLGFSNIKNHADYDGKDVKLKTFDEMGIHTAAIKELEIDERVIKSNLDSEDGDNQVMDRKVKFKLHDKIKSLELIGKNLGLFEKDNGDEDKDINIHITYDD